MGTRKLRRNLKKWFAVVTAAVLTLTAVNASGFTGLFAEEGNPITIETTQTVNEDPVTATVTINATAKEGYSVSSITFNNETIEGEEGTFTVFANGEYQVAVKYTTEGEIETTASPVTSLEPTASAEASEEPIDEGFGISGYEETVTPEITEEATPVVTEEVTPETTEEVIPEATEEVIPEVTEETVPAEQSEEEPEAEVTPETALNFFTAVNAEETTPEATEETVTPTTTEETYTETITVEGLVEEGTFVSVEETDEMLDNLAAVLGAGVTVTKNEEKSTELGYNVYDAVANDPSDELAVSVEGTYTHGFTAGSKDETTGWYIAIPGLDPVQWAFSFSDATEGNHDSEAREAAELMPNTTISNVVIHNVNDNCTVEKLDGFGHSLSEFSQSCPVDRISTTKPFNQKITISFDFSTDVGVGNSIKVGDTVTIPLNGVNLVNASPVELRDASNALIGTWEVTGNNIIIRVTNVPTANYLMSGSISTSEFTQFAEHNNDATKYIVRNGTVGDYNFNYLLGSWLNAGDPSLEYKQFMNKGPNNTSSSNIRWDIGVDNGIAGFVNNGYVESPTSYEDIIINDTFPAGTQVSLNSVVASIGGTLNGSTYLGVANAYVTNKFTLITQSGSDTLQTFKAKITPLCYGLFKDSLTGETTVIVNLGSMATGNTTGLKYDAISPTIGTYLRATSPTFSSITQPAIDAMNNGYAGKSVQKYTIFIDAIYPSVAANTGYTNVATIDHNGTITTLNGSGVLTPGAGLLSAPDPGSVKLIKSNNYSQLLDGATFKLQWLNGATWTDVTVNAADVTTGTGSGTSLQTASGQLIVAGLIDGQTYRFVETATPSGYKALNATNYPTNFVSGEGIVSDTFTANTTAGSVVTMKNLLDEANYKVEHYTGPADGSAYVKKSEETKQKVAGQAPDANPATITGYKFNTSATTYEDSGHTTAQTAALPVNMDGTLVVKLYYNPIEYKIKYDGNAVSGCSLTGTMADQTGIKYDANVTLTANAYACAGYTFGGWNTKADGTGTSYTNSQSNVKNLSSTDNGTATLYAVWTPNTNTAYTVEHYKQNVDGTYPTTATETENKTGTTDATVVINTVEKTYAGFTTDTSLTKYKDSVNTTASTTVLTIKCDGSLVVQVFYKRNTHNITYSYTGTIPTGAPTVPAQETGVRYGASKTVATNPVLNGYTFSGWAPTSAGTTYTMPDRNVSLTGHWTEKTGYTVKYETNGGNAIVDMTGVTWTQDTLDQGLTPTRSGYTFNGWYTDSALTTAYANDTYADIAITDTVMDITLYAKWTYIPTPDPATPDPGRTCQDDGYPAGYYWNGTACVIDPTPTPTYTPTPTPTATPRPTVTPTVNPSTSPDTSASPIATNSASSNTGTVSPNTDINITSSTTDSGDHPSYGWTTSKWALINLLAALVSLILAIVLLVNKSSKEEEEDNDTQKRYNSQGEVVPYIYKRKKIYKIILVVVAIVSLVLFILTENIQMPMQLVDKWTLLMVVLAALSIIGFILGRKWTEDEDAEQDRLAE